MKKQWIAWATAFFVGALAAIGAWGQAPKAADKGARQATAGEGALNYLIEPVPAWVVPARDAAPGVQVERAPMRYRLLDDQIRVEERGATSYHRVVRVVDSAEGLAMAAQIEYDFDPSYQTFVWHHLDVVRAGKRTSRLDRKRIQVLRRETNLERQMVDGRASVAIALEDVRVGDEVDIAYSVRGTNPVFEGKFIDWVQLGGARAPTIAHQIRLLAPAQRVIQVTQLPKVESSSRQLGALRETTYRAEGLPIIRFDPGAPSSAYLAHVLQFSEYSDWPEVVRWGRRLFDNRATAPALDAKAAEIAAASKDPQARVLAALDFVQRDVRYFGTEGGINSHRPQPPADVLARRFGDCKDKVGLLVALLRRLDIEATPVLVSTSQRAAVDRMLVGPDAFNHAIARVDVGGATYWLDATRSRQSGPLKLRSATGFGRGLVLQEGANSLATLPDGADQERMAVTDALRFDSLAGDARLDSRITYRGEMAELVRDALTTRGQETVVNELSTWYRKLYPTLKVAAPVQVLLPDEDDALVLVQRFTIPEFWRLQDERVLLGEVLAWSLPETLSFPKSETRRDALDYSYPGIYRHTITMDFNEDLLTPIAAGQRVEDGDRHFRWTSDMQGTRRQMTQTSQLRMLGKAVEPAEWTAFVAKVGKVVPRMASTMTIPALPVARQNDLAEQLKDTKAFMATYRFVPATQVQARAMVRGVLFTEQLEAGRLSPRLQAQVLAARGVAYDNIGRLQEAKADFARSLELAPGQTDVLNGAAVNALALGELPNALALTGKVLEQDAGNAEALRVRALTRYMQGDYAGAIADSGLALRDGPEGGRGYRLLLMALAAKRSGQSLDGVESAFPRDQWPTAWPRPLIEHLWGRGSLDDVVKAAKGTGDPTGSLVEAYFYIGERLAATGDKGGAITYWKKAVDQKVLEFQEHTLATYRLGH